MADDNEHLFSGYDRSDYEVGSNDTVLPPLPPYRPSAYLPKRPPVTTSFDHFASDASLNGFTSDVPNTTSPSDPHDFYRRRTPYKREVGQDYNPSDVAVRKREENMIATSRSPHRLSTAYNSPLATRFGSRYDTRIAPSPNSDRPSITGAKSNPQLGTIGRNRQTSLQELVNRFNQTPDEVPPLPTKPGSRSTSANTSPATTNGPRPFHNRTPVETARSAHSATTRTPLSAKEPSRNSPISPRRRKTPSENVNPTSFGTRAQRKPPTIANNTYASQSMTNLVPKIDAAPRRPLFGEVLAVTTTSSDPGFGIQGAQRRRGSEGSMHTPNPMFAEERSNLPSRVSPSSPTAWYLGVTPSLDGINLDKPVPARPPGMHRRSRSDFSGTYSGPHSNAPLASSVGKTITIMSPTQEAPSPLVSPTSKRNSQSRIPISTRRASVASDSGNSSSSRAPSAASFRKPPTKAFSALANSKSSVSSSSSNRQNIPSPNPRSSRRGNVSPLRFTPGASPRLAAYISESPPAKSPPLRSSRPRQPVSTATTSASRARAAERLANTNNPSNGKTRERRSRNWPELGNVDFAARRKQIEQAVTKTVKENEERKAVEEEKKRMSMVLDARLQKEASEKIQAAAENQPGVIDEQPEIQNDNTASPSMEEERYATPPTEMPKSDRELTINTTHMNDRPGLDLNQEDSPTLGMANGFLDLRKLHTASPRLPSDSEPTSPVTAGTLFDNDPQEGLSGLNNEYQIRIDQSDRSPIPADHTDLANNQNSGDHITSEHITSEHELTDDHHTVLNNIMHLRATSPDDRGSVRSSDAIGLHQTEDSSSDRDDQESIQIMLGETPVTERASEAHQLPRSSLDDLMDEPSNRWSADSWTSSVNTRERHSIDREREMPMERIDEHAPQTDEPAQVSFSTTVVDDGGLPWSPSQSSLLSGHTNLDSDSYSTINRVLDSYHDPALMSPESIRDFQQQLLAQSPNLARAAGWDPKKMTQMYLQSLGRAPYAQQNAVPDPLRFSEKTVEASGTASSHSQAEDVQNRQQENGEFEAEGVEYDHDCAEYEDGISARESLQVTGMANPQRASLNHPDDFADTSPSLLDWFSSQRDVETPPDDKPLPISKDWEDVVLEVPDHLIRPRTRTPDSHIQLPEIQRTEDGTRMLDINIESPHSSPMTARQLHTLRDTGASTSRVKQSDYDYHQPYAMSSDSIPTQVHRKRSTEPPQPSSVAKPPVPTADSVSRAVERSSSDGPTGLAEPVNGATPSPEQKRMTRRRHILKEIVDTEASYGQDMKVVTDIYKGTSLQVIESADDMKVLFGNADQIVAFSQTFFDALKQAAKSVYVVPKSKRWRSKRDSEATTASGNTDDQSSIGGADMNDDEKDRMTFIGEVFATHMRQMERVYGEYLRNYDNASAKLIALQLNPTIKIWLNECSTWALDLTNAWDLDSLLVKPVQRILKYPLLLKELLDVTPENHPDYTNLDSVAREIVGMSRRINDAKKRLDMVGQLSAQRKKGLGLKAFTRRTEKLKQQVGLTDSLQDEAYDAVAEKFGVHFFQVQVVMRDIEMYTSDVQNFVNRFNDFVSAIEAHMDVGQSTYPEVESKWRKFRICMREITATALTEHIAAVRKISITPLSTLLRLYDSPQRLMEKRKKKALDYVKWKTIKDKGDKPDKKIVEASELFTALNDTLKDDLPKLFALTGDLVTGCLNNFVQLQLQWNKVWRRKLSQVIDNATIPDNVEEYINSFRGDFEIVESQVLTLGIANGSVLADTVNFLGPIGGLDGASSPRRTSTNNVDLRIRGYSQSNGASPMLPQPDFGDQVSIPGFGNNLSHQAGTGRRIRASSSASGTGRSPKTPEIPGGWRNYPTATTPTNAHSNRPSTSTGRSIETPSLPRLSVDTPGFNRLSGDSYANRASSNSTYLTGRSDTPTHRTSGIFSSAMPMSDSPRSQSPNDGSIASKPYINVLFLAASVYEFNIDRARQEAGYPYLTYVAGEIFDVIGEKGELWLAKNQDDASNQVGWIWNKHFAKLASN
ncbi:hypothetical protein MMC30_004224 [Trapelia coarctata]|nr:hypothetical protein [Trapelia coarctata]